MKTIHRDPDATLVKFYLKNHDHKSFEVLYEKYKDDIFNYCCRFLNDEVEAADCTQDIFIRAFRHIHTFRFKSRFSTWLFRITINTCYNYLRARSKLNKAPVAQMVNHIQEPSPDPQKALSVKEVSMAFQDALGRLVETQRSVIILRDLEGKSYEEIAQISNLNPGTVRSTLARARYKMAEYLKDYRNGL